jgi:hypothetical protein
LIGTDIYERAIVNQYLSWYQNEFRPAFFELTFLRMRALLIGKS